MNYTKKLLETWGLLGGIVAGVAILLAIFAVVNAPVEAIQGLPQKIFYLHVNLAWNGFGLCMLGVGASIVYLISRNMNADRVAASMMEVGMIYMTGVLVTGPIWAKPIWGTFWVWDPRLTTTLMLWILLAIYQLLRDSIASKERRARMSAIVALLISVNIPVIHVSVLWWRSLHPLPVVMRPKEVGGGLDPDMRSALLMMFIALLMIGAVLVPKVYRLKLAQERLEELKSI